MTDVHAALDRALSGGPERHRVKAAEQGKLPVRERVARLLDDGSFVEEGLLANWQEEGLGADGVVTGSGANARRPGPGLGHHPPGQAGPPGAHAPRESLPLPE